MTGWTTDLRRLGKGASKDIRDILADAQARGGWMGRRLKNNHLSLRHVTGGSTVMPSTTNNYRSVLNAKADLRRIEGGSR